MKSIALFDFEDSFTFNIYSELLSTPDFESSSISVIHWSQFSLNIIEKFDVIILGPGPGHPDDYGEILPRIYQWLHSSGGRYQSFMGICLGHQLIWRALGACVKRSQRPLHGHTEDFQFPAWDIFSPHDVGRGMKVQRYNSQVVKAPEVLPRGLSGRVGNVAQHHEIQASFFQLSGLSGLTMQFHPESVGTSCPNLFFRALAASFEYNIGDGSTNRRTL